MNGYFQSQGITDGHISMRTNDGLRARHWHDSPRACHYRIYICYRLLFVEPWGFKAFQHHILRHPTVDSGLQPFRITFPLGLLARAVPCALLGPQMYTCCTTYNVHVWGSGLHLALRSFMWRSLDEESFDQTSSTQSPMCIHLMIHVWCIGWIKISYIV